MNWANFSCKRVVKVKFLGKGLIRKKPKIITYEPTTEMAFKSIAVFMDE